MDDQALIARLKQRDPAAFAQAFEAHSNRIYRLAVGILHDDQQADGVVQDTFLKLIEHLDNFEGRASIGTWLYRVAVNECMMRVRRAKQQVALDTFEEADMMPTCLINWADVPDDVIGGEEARAHMQRAIDALPATLRTVFTLRDIEELSTAETAAILGISEAAVKVRLHRARLALREGLASYFDERVAQRTRPSGRK